mgnify:CR=1 FL=1
MIEKIFIPTVHRVNNQITYNNLSKSLKNKVCMVVQAWEIDKYDYECEYLVLPNTDEYHFSEYYCLPKTRLLIYEHGKNIKYAVLDDDIKFLRRNSKYFSNINNMTKSKRNATEADLIEMFDLYGNWLDETTVCGCSHVENPPGNKPYAENSSLGSALWINGNDFKDHLDSWKLTDVRVMEDTNFLLTLLTNGYSNRVSQEFCFQNQSATKKDIASTVWDQQSFDDTHRDHKIIESRFPNIFKILYDDNGERVAGGYRNYGKVSVQWSKAYKKSKISTLEKFLY